jgi:hypothetical protein
MAISCVVQGIPEEAVKAATLEGLLEVAEKQEISVQKQKERSYFDAFDLSVTMGNVIGSLEEEFIIGQMEEDY